jgi:hypothetical protein
MRHSWEIPFVLAILQTDEDEAIEAIEQRRLPTTNSAENVALMGAEAGVDTEMTAKCV